MAIALGDLDFPIDMVREVAVIHSEPLHLFVKSELVDGGLVGLRGKRLCLGVTGTTAQKTGPALADHLSAWKQASITSKTI